MIFFSKDSNEHGFFYVVKVVEENKKKKTKFLDNELFYLYDQYRKYIYYLSLIKDGN